MSNRRRAQSPLNHRSRCSLRPGVARSVPHPHPLCWVIASFLISPSSCDHDYELPVRNSNASHCFFFFFSLTGRFSTLLMDSERYKCEWPGCGVQASMKWIITRHNKAVHLKEKKKKKEKKFQCHICPYRTYQKCDLRRHMSQHEGDEHRVDECSRCRSVLAWAQMTGKMAKDITSLCVSQRRNSAMSVGKHTLT